VSPDHDQIGVVAAGHQLSAQAGADVLRAGGNAVDAALGAMLTSFVCEPLLTGLGAGGHMLVVAPGEPAVLLDFFVAAPGSGPGGGSAPGAGGAGGGGAVDGTSCAPLVPARISFGDAVQVFHVGVASVGMFGLPAGICEASSRFGRVPLDQLVAPAAKLARDGVTLTEPQARIVEMLVEIVTSTPEAAALFAPAGDLLRAGDTMRQPELADALTRLGADGARPFYEGDIGRAITTWLRERGGLLTAGDMAAYEVVHRAPLTVGYRGRDVLTNPPPSAGGILIAHALMLLDGIDGPPPVDVLVEAMVRAQSARTPEFLDSLGDPGFAKRFLARPGGRLGSTTHIAALDGDGWACSVTCSNGASSGVIVPGTGIHLNNMLGEQDLNPLGFHRHPPGRRMPSMMAPTVVLRDGVPALAVGSAGSNRIRSAIVQTIIGSIDHGLAAQAAVDAPRVHFEDGIVYTEPGVDSVALARAGRPVSRFRSRNLFFGGAQAAARAVDGTFSGGGDPRRGGAAVLVSP
jgi:gamma-glutamyltranspeptidase/glutathione hydrolase